MKNSYKTLISGLFPLAFLILGYLACEQLPGFSELQLNIFYYAPYVILTLSSAFSWKFNRSRSFFMSMIFILSLISLHYTEDTTVLAKPLYQILCIVLPINIFTFTFWKERGFVSLWGMLRLSFILSQVGFVYWIVVHKQEELLNKLIKDVLPLSLEPTIMISQISFILFLLTFLALGTRILLYRTSQDLSFLYILIALFQMLNKNKFLEYSIYFTVFGILLILSILKDTYMMAFYDELTGIPSRRALNQDLMKLGMKYSIAMVDIDFFKKFNDTYGHETGDEVLRFIASIIKEVKGGGKAYRYGGEEFTILFPGKSLTSVLPVLDELRETIAKRGFTVRKNRRAKYSSKRKAGNNAKRRGSKTDTTKKIFIHVSIGVAQKDENNKTTSNVIKAADTALYRAKKKGRNCVCK